MKRNYTNDIHPEVKRLCTKVSENISVPSMKLISLFYNRDHEPIQDFMSFYHNITKKSTFVRTPKFDLNSFSNKTIKYYGSLGMTGYSQSSKDYYFSLWNYFNSHPEMNINLVFKTLHYHEGFQKTLETPNWQDKIIEESSNESNDKYDLVILHSIPIMWPKIIEKERNSNPNVKIIGFGVWECNSIPKDWISWMNKVNLIITPCYWNRHVFQKQLTVPISTIHNPCQVSIKVKTDNKSSKIMFYTIGEWNRRKGIEKLIEIFIKTFVKNSDQVFLYIKTNGIQQHLAQEFVLDCFTRFNEKFDPNLITIDTEFKTQEEMDNIHQKGDIFISLCCSEATGLGALYALGCGNPVIITGYGGQLDYLKAGTFYISFFLEDANPCKTIQKGHESCSEKFCRKYPFFSGQKWASACNQDASRLMKFVYSNIEECKKSALLGAKYISTYFNSDAIAKCYIKEVQQLF